MGNMWAIEPGKYYWLITDTRGNTVATVTDPEELKKYRAHNITRGTL